MRNKSKFQKIVLILTIGIIPLLSYGEMYTCNKTLKFINFSSFVKDVSIQLIDSLDINKRKKEIIFVLKIVDCNETDTTCSFAITYIRNQINIKFIKPTHYFYNKENLILVEIPDVLNNCFNYNSITDSIYTCAKNTLVNPKIKIINYEPSYYIIELNKTNYIINETVQPEKYRLMYTPQEMFNLDRPISIEELKKLLGE